MVGSPSLRGSAFDCFAWGFHGIQLASWLHRRQALQASVAAAHFSIQGGAGQLSCRCCAPKRACAGEL